MDKKNRKGWLEKQPGKRMSRAAAPISVFRTDGNPRQEGLKGISGSREKMKMIHGFGERKTKILYYRIFREQACSDSGNFFTFLSKP
jgi:hypothetical protein